MVPAAPCEKGLAFYSTSVWKASHCFLIDRRLAFSIYSCGAVNVGG